MNHHPHRPCPGLTRHPLALAAATALIAVLSAPAQAAVTVAGDYWVSPSQVPIGPGDTLLPSSAVWVGSPGVGSLQVDGGSFLQLARLSFGSGGTGNGSGLITGAGTRVELVTDDSVFTHRLVIGDWGTGSLTVSAGAVLESPREPACWQAGRYCDSFVGDAAGDTGNLLLKGVPGLSLFAEYLHNEKATRESFDEHGYFITGDRVTLLEDGFIRFGDRAKDMLKVGRGRREHKVPAQRGKDGNQDPHH